VVFRDAFAGTTCPVAKSLGIGDNLRLLDADPERKGRDVTLLLVQMVREPGSRKGMRSRCKDGTCIALIESSNENYLPTLWPVAGISSIVEGMAIGKTATEVQPPYLCNFAG